MRVARPLGLRHRALDISASECTPRHNAHAIDAPGGMAAAGGGRAARTRKRACQSPLAP